MKAMVTGGEWKVGRLGCGDLYVASGTTFVARICDEPEAEGNAKLIASAKAMRSALVRIASIQNKDFGGDWEEIDEARRIASEALKLSA